MTELHRHPVAPARPFDDAEYWRRMTDPRARMTAAGIDLLVVTNTSNICYLTGYDTMMPSAYSVLLVPLTGDLTFHCAEVEVPCMMYASDLRNVVAFDWIAYEDAATQLARLLAEGGYTGRTIGVEMAYAET